MKTPVPKKAFHCSNVTGPTILVPDCTKLRKRRPLHHPSPTPARGGDGWIGLHQPHMLTYLVSPRSQKYPPVHVLAPFSLLYVLGSLMAQGGGLPGSLPLCRPPCTINLEVNASCQNRMSGVLCTLQSTALWHLSLASSCRGAGCYIRSHDAGLW